MTLVPKKVDSQFLIRIIRNEVSEEEREYFEQWLSESDANREEYANTLLLWEQMGKSNLPKLPDAEMQWGEIISKIEKKEAARNFLRPYRINPSRFNSENLGIWITRIAAIIILAVTALLLKNSMAPSGKPAPVVAVSNNHPTNIVKYELVAGKGERITLPLSDGSVIYLNSDTRVVYPKQFEADSREVEVTGEAYFIVAHDKSRPFSVKSGQITTVVTGTEFNVMNRKNRIEVVVAKGSIKVMSKSSGKVVAVEKGQKVTATAAGNLKNACTANLGFDLAWRDNKLAFSNTRLSEIMEEIERNYNVHVSFKNEELKTRTLTGVIEGKSLDQVLALINLTLDINIKQQGLTVIVE